MNRQSRKHIANEERLRRPQSNPRCPKDFAPHNWHLHQRLAQRGCLANSLVKRAAK